MTNDFSELHHMGSSCFTFLLTLGIVVLFDIILLIGSYYIIMVLIYSSLITAAFFKIKNTSLKHKKIKKKKALAPFSFDLSFPN